MISIEDIETDIEEDLEDDEIQEYQDNENICPRCTGNYIVKALSYEDVESYGYIDRIPIYSNVCEDCGYVEVGD